MHTDQSQQHSIHQAINIGLQLREIIAEHSEGKMNHREYQILEFVVEEYLAHRRVVMEQGMGLKHLGSRYTLRKSIQTLIDHNFLAIEYSEDSRLRPLVPTEHALHLFAAIGDRISRLVVTST